MAFKIIFNVCFVIKSTKCHFFEKKFNSLARDELGWKYIHISGAKNTGSKIMDSLV